jgi:hypothetical protein
MSQMGKWGTLRPARLFPGFPAVGQVEMQRFERARGILLSLDYVQTLGIILQR